MLRMVLADYRMEFKKACKREKKSVWDWIFPILQGALIVFTSCDIREKFDFKFILFSGILYLIMIYGIKLEELYPTELGKMFFIIPVSAKEKLNYLITSYLFKVFTPVMLSFLWLIIFFGQGMISLWEVVFFMINIFTVFSLSNTYSMDKRKRLNAGVNTTRIWSLVHGGGCLLSITAALVWMFYGDTAMFHNPYAKYYMGFLMIVEIVVVVIALSIFWKCKKKELGEK